MAQFEIVGSVRVEDVPESARQGRLSRWLPIYERVQADSQEGLVTVVTVQGVNPQNFRNAIAYGFAKHNLGVSVQLRDKQKDRFTAYIRLTGKPPQRRNDGSRGAPRIVDRETVLNLSKQGLGVRQIAYRVGCAPSTVSRILWQSEQVNGTEPAPVA